MLSSSVLLLSASPANRDVFAAAARASLGVHTERAANAAQGWLRDHHPPAILVDDLDGGAPEACERVRADQSLANVPILGISSSISELPFEHLLASGADDLCARSASTIATRLRHVVTAKEAPARARGVAVVADADPQGRAALARALRRAGYGVAFAQDVEQAIDESMGAGVALGRGRPAAPGDVHDGAAPARARRRGCKAPWVIGVPPKELARTRQAVAAVPDVAIFDVYGPPENVLYVANELRARGRSDGRAAPRLLYGTTVRFRAVGAEEEEIGFSFNISAGGLYVRPLAPPRHGEDIWIEFQPPRSPRRVHLEGRVAWTRGFGPHDDAVAPPGFGVQISGGSVRDLEWHTRKCAEYLAEIG